MSSRFKQSRIYSHSLLLGLDQLAHWLQSDEDVGRAVIFALIFLTTFRTSLVISHTSLLKLILEPYRLLYFHFIPTSSSHSSVLHAHYIIRLYFRSLDWSYHLLFRLTRGRTDCIYSLSCFLPGDHLAVALMYHHHQTRRPGYRETAQTPLPHPRRPVPVQCHELSPCGITDPDFAYLHDMHCAFLVQAHHSHEYREFNTLVCRIPC